jgi:hypothetical protein
MKDDGIAVDEAEEEVGEDHLTDDLGKVLRDA